MSRLIGTEENDCTPEKLAHAIFVKHNHSNEEFRSKFVRLALAMELDQNDYEGILDKEDDVTSKLVNILVKWFSSSETTPTVEDFVNCLEKVKLKSAASAVKQEFLPTTVRRRSRGDEMPEFPIERQEKVPLTGNQSDISKPRDDQISTSVPTDDRDFKPDDIWTAFYTCKGGLPLAVCLIYIFVSVMLMPWICFKFKTCPTCQCSPVSSIRVPTTLEHVNVSVVDQHELVSNLEDMQAINLNLSVMFREGKWHGDVEEKPFPNVFHLWLSGDVDVSNLYVVLLMFENILTLSIQRNSQRNCETNTFPVKSDIEVIVLKQLQSLTLQGYPLCNSAYHALFFRLKFPNLEKLTINYYEFKVDNLFYVTSLMEGPMLDTVNLSLQLNTTLNLCKSSQATIAVSHLYMRNKYEAEIGISEDFCKVFPNIIELSVKNFWLSYSKLEFILACATIKFLNISVRMKNSVQLRTLNVWEKNIFLERVRLNISFPNGQCPSINEFQDWYSSLRKQPNVSSNCALDTSGDEQFYTLTSR